MGYGTILPLIWEMIWETSTFSTWELYPNKLWILWTSHYVHQIMDIIYGHQ
jgi:hypothetical protein